MEVTGMPSEREAADVLAIGDEVELAGEDFDPTSIEIRKSRKVVKLDYEKLKSSKGLPYVLKHGPKRARISSRRDTYQNLCHILQFYQLWAHELYPKAKFKDFVAICDRLGKNDKLLRQYRINVLRTELGISVADVGEDTAVASGGSGSRQVHNEIPQLFVNEPDRDGGNSQNDEVSDDLYKPSRMQQQAGRTAEKGEQEQGQEEMRLLKEMEDLEREAQEMEDESSEEDGQLAILREIEQQY